MTGRRRGPLDGIVVIDLTRVLAGPFCTMQLFDMGARIIKVEHPDGDDARHFGPFIDGRSAYFDSLNRGKESIALDLGDKADRALFESLLAGADVLVENFRPGALARRGYDWPTLHKRYPRLIYATLSGFGDSGPYRDRPAYDMVVQAMGGIMSITGEADGAPVRVGTSIGDITAALFATSGILSALYERQSGGQGSKIDIAMLDCQVAILENAIARYCATGSVPGPLGARHPSIAPFGVFRAADKPLVIAAGNDAMFRRLCKTIGAGELAADGRFSDNHGRCDNAEALAAALEAALATAPAAEWLGRLENAGIPAGPINDIAAVCADPQVAARNMIVPVAGQEGLKVAGNPIKNSAFDDPGTRPGAPLLDQHRAALVAEFVDP